MVKIRQAAVRSSSYALGETEDRSLRDRLQSSEDRAQCLEEQLLATEQRAQDAELRAKQASFQLHASVSQLEEINRYCKDAEERALEATHRVQTIEPLLDRATQDCEEAERRFTESENRLRQAEAILDQHAILSQRRIQELSSDSDQLRQDLQLMERRARLAEQAVENMELNWVVHHRDIQITERELGGGGWGVVKIAKFRGIEVAAKSLYEQIRSDYYRQLFIREMNMAARLRHPNLVQFIGATLEGEMVILTELMHISLRRVLEQGGISRDHTISISVQVCQALNYLHLMQPDPVIHRDISSANILLNPLPNNGWLAKVTDYGSVNTLRALQTENPGNPVYAAPEARVPSLQSTKMDIFSVGILMIEMCTGQFPNSDEREHLLLTIPENQVIGIIRCCIDQEKDNRPTAKELLAQLQLFMS